MVFKFIAIVLFVSAVFATYGTRKVFDAVTYKSHQNTDAMLDALDLPAEETTYV